MLIGPLYVPFGIEYRVVVERDNHCWPLSPKYRTLKDAARYYDSLVNGPLYANIKGVKLLVSSYSVDDKGHATWLQDHDGFDMAKALMGVDHYDGLSEACALLAEAATSLDNAIDHDLISLPVIGKIEAFLNQIKYNAINEYL